MLLPMDIYGLFGQFYACRSIHTSAGLSISSLRGGGFFIFERRCWNGMTWHGYFFNNYNRPRF